MKPAVKILLEAVKERGLEFRLENGKANLFGDRKEVTPELIAALKHFRTEILEASGIVEETTPLPVAEQEEPPAKQQPNVPPGATIVIADADAYTDKAMRGPAYMWTFLGADRWWYVKDYPIPKMKGKR